MRAAISSFETARSRQAAQPTDRIAAPRSDAEPALFAASAGEVSSASSGTDVLQQLLGCDRLGVRHRALREASEDLAGARLDEALDPPLVQRRAASRASAPASSSASARRARTSSNGSVVMELITVTSGSAKSISASAASSSGRAPAIAGEWNAPVTGSGTARRPCSRAASVAVSNAAFAPDSTTWFGALSFATVNPAASATAPARSAAPLPSSASIEPSPARSPDSCIRRPRIATSRSPSSAGSAPAATSAATSPSEWPA